MAFCLAELTLWSSRSSLNVQDTDVGTFQYYEKGEPVFPADQHYYCEKQHFAETRGYPWFLSKRRPEKLRDALKELEHLGVGVSLSSQGIFEGDQQDLEQELLQSNTCVCTKWRTKHCCQMLLSSGVLVTITLSGSQLERVGIDKTLMGRLPADTISHAVIGERFILLSLVEKSQVCQVYLGRRNQSSPELSSRRLEKLSGADIKVSSLELAGGGGRRTSRRVALNRAQDVGVCWWQGSHDEVWPWSPLPSASERANLVLLGFSESPGLMVLSSIRTSGEPLDCCFSLTQPYQILTVELHKEAHSSTAELHEEANHSNMEFHEESRIAQTCVYECTRGRLQRLSATALPSVPVSWCRDPSERWLLLGLHDSSVLLLHTETGLQTRVTCPMLPSLLVWHPEGGLIVVAGGQGELQCFDLGLSPLRLQLVFEEEVIGTSLQLAKHVKVPGGLECVEWAHSSMSQGVEGLEVHDLLMLRFHRGPMAALKLRLGVLNGAQLGAGEFLQHRLRCGEVDAAIGILGNMDWCMMGADCFRGLISVTDHLLRKPLNEQTEAQLEATLGMFYSPSRALTDTVILEFRDPISRYARRFFHHLLRHQRFEKAFLLALDIGARDLFMDLHYVARDNGEPVLASVAQRKAQELDAEEVTTSDQEESQHAVKQNEVSLSPIKTHPEWTNRGKARKNTRVDSKRKMDRERGEDLAETTVNPSLWPWTQTEFTLNHQKDQVSKDPRKLEVIHFGIV